MDPDPASPRPTTDSARLDDGAFTAFVEPRSPGRLPIDPGTWHHVSRRYLWVEVISSVALLAVVAAATVVVVLVLHQSWALLPGGGVAVILLIALALAPRRIRSIGYQLREDDLVFRRGILWQRQVAVPYGRMQLVDITHGPLDRAFRTAQLKLVTAAAATAVAIPGLDQEAAEALRDHLVDVAEHRRTGL